MCSLFGYERTYVENLTSTQVEIGLLHDLGYATSVATEPLTADDWEILVKSFHSNPA